MVWLRNRCAEFLIMKEDGVDYLIWILTVLDSIWQSRNAVIWKGDSINTLTTIHIISLKVKDYREMSTPFPLSPNRSSNRVNTPETIDMTSIQWEHNALIFSWKKRRQGLWLAAGVIKRRMVVKWIGRFVPSYQHKTIPLLDFIRDVLRTLPEGENFYWLGLPNQHVANILHGSSGSTSERVRCQDINHLLSNCTIARVIFTDKVIFEMVWNIFSNMFLRPYRLYSFSLL